MRIPGGTLVYCKRCAKLAPDSGNSPSRQNISAMLHSAENTAGELQAFGEVGLLPLLPLTRGGDTRSLMEKMFTDLQAARKLDLLQIGQMIASLAFGERRPDDQEWVMRRYRQMYDRLQDTPVYKEMVRLASEKARAEALQEAQAILVR